jgi:DUF2075 family protein
MIVYQSTKLGFCSDVVNNVIETKIEEVFLSNLKRKPIESEKRAWQNSMMYMENVLSNSKLPNDIGVMIEYQLPQMMKRIDFMLTGRNSQDQPHLAIVELKQWSEAEATDMDGIVLTAINGGIRETEHPSYQAYVYAQTLKNYNSAVEEKDIQFSPCAYLHNMKNGENLKSDFYKQYTDLAPMFIRSEVNELRDFLSSFIVKGDKGTIMGDVEKGDIRPTKKLAESLQKMVSGSNEFYLMDQQKVIYEKVLHFTKNKEKQKKVLIAEGGPGTGKSVIAINLLSALTTAGKLVKYVSKNSAPRSVYKHYLKETIKLSDIDLMFSGSGSFTNADKNVFDVLLVDEAHRLNEKSGMFKNLGENQVKEIINSSKVSVFFLDEDQKVAMDDIGSKEEIHKWAKELGADVYEYKLESQFRCNGSDGYISWLDNMLQIRETANINFEQINYDFKVFDDPDEMRDAIIEKNKINNKSRIVAGYCWDWVSATDKNKDDIVIGDFKMKWNLKDDGMLWMVKPNSINEAGCIHTCQGLELDYVGVIIGDDLIYRDGEVLVDPTKRSSRDKSIFGWKKFMKEDPENAKRELRNIIKNTYRTLMTRGQKGCYIYCTDEELREYVKELL